MLKCKVCGHEDMNLVPHIESAHANIGLAGYMRAHGATVNDVIHPDMQRSPSPTMAMAAAAAAPAPAATEADHVILGGFKLKKVKDLDPKLASMIPKLDPAYQFPAALVADFVYCLQEGKPLALTGHTGTGKTSLIMQVAARIGQPVIRVNLNQQTTVGDFVGHMAAKAGTTEWVDGVLPWAMKAGIWLIADEVDYGEPAILSALNGVLESGGKLILTEKGHEIVTGSAGFRAFATGNCLGVMAEYRHLYQGTNLMNEAFIDRFHVLKVDYMPEELESQVVKDSIPFITANVAKELVRVANMVRKAFLEETVACTFSTRRLLDWAHLTVFNVRVRKMKEDAPFAAAESTVFAKVCKEDKIAIEGIMKRVLLGGTK